MVFIVRYSVGHVLITTILNNNGTFPIVRLISVLEKCSRLRVKAAFTSQEYFHAGQSFVVLTIESVCKKLK